MHACANCCDCVSEDLAVVDAFCGQAEITRAFRPELTNSPGGSMMRVHPTVNMTEFSMLLGELCYKSLYDLAMCRLNIEADSICRRLSCHVFDSFNPGDVGAKVSGT